MGKRSTVPGNDTDKLTLDIDEKLTDNTLRKVSLRCLIDAKVTVTVNGHDYKFSGSGTVVEVDEADSRILLSRRYGRKPCCGARLANTNQMFELA